MLAEATFPCVPLLKMAPIDKFMIIPDNVKAFYSPGDEISGRVFLSLKSSMSVRKVTVGFHGVGHVAYSTSQTIYKLTQPYFDYKTVVYSVYNETENQQLGGKFPAGEFWFPFIFKLPLVCLPSSYRDSNGSIRYWLDSVIERRMQFDEKTAVDIFVMDPIDVNTPELQQCQTKQHETTISCCCVKGGKVNVSGKTNKGGFYAGEVIETKFFVENQSNREVTYTEVVLMKKLCKKYGEDDGQEDTDMSVVARVRGIGVPVGQEADVTDMKLTIPDSLPPSTSLEDSIVTVSYRLLMIAHVEGACVSAVRVDLSIKIGLISFPTGCTPSHWKTLILQTFSRSVNAQLDQEGQEGQTNQTREARIPQLTCAGPLVPEISSDVIRHTDVTPLLKLLSCLCSC